jgi:hypothetical protein
MSTERSISKERDIFSWGNVYSCFTTVPIYLIWFISMKKVVRNHFLRIIRHACIETNTTHDYYGVWNGKYYIDDGRDHQVTPLVPSHESRTYKVIHIL